MKKRVLVSAAVSALLLSSCGHDIEKNNSMPKIETTVTTTTAATTVTEPKVTEAAAEITPEPEPEAEKKLVMKGTKELSVYDEITVKDFVTKTNAKLKSPDTLIKTDEIGEFEVVIEYTLNGKNAKKKLKYTVTDNTAPMIMSLSDTVYLDYGEDFDVYSSIAYADNYDRSPQITFDGSIDSYTYGTYPVSATVTDSSGNYSTCYFNVAVSDESTEFVYGNPETDFSDILSQYSSINAEVGLDISQWQGDIDFNAVKNAGCSFVIIRIGICSDEFEADERYYEYINGAKEAGLKTGVYFYSADNDVEEVKEHARHIVEMLNGQQLDFPVAFDWERFDIFQQFGINIHDLNDMFEAFSDELEQFGYSTMIYSSKNFADAFWENRKLRPMWIASYSTDLDYDGNFVMWQKSGNGYIDGINAAVDIDIFYPNNLA